MRHAITSYGPAIVWAAFLLLLGSQSGLRLPSVSMPFSIPMDKVAHFGMYGVLGGLAAWGWRRAGKWPAPFILILGGMMVGAVDEIHQSFLPYRTAELGDWIADAIGILVGFSVVGWLGGRVEWRKGTDGP